MASLRVIEVIMWRERKAWRFVDVEGKERDLGAMIAFMG
jgi:hypothetical protein